MIQSTSKRKKIWFLIGAAVIFSFWFTGFNISDLFSRGSQFFVIIGKMCPPDRTYTGKVIGPLMDTIAMSLSGTLIGSVLALVISPFCASNTISHPFVYTLLKAVINMIRAIPVLIIALLSSFVFGIGSFAGTFAISLYTFGIITRLTWKNIEQVSHNTFDALKNAGIESIKVYIITVFMDTFPNYLSNCLYVLESNVRHAAILGYVGSGGLGLILSEKISWGDYPKVGMILGMLFIVVLIIETISSYFRRILNGQIHIGANTHRRDILIVLFIFMIIFSLVEVEGPHITSSGLKIFKGMVYGMFNPDISLIFSFAENSVLRLMAETVCIATAGTFVGALFSIAIAFLGSRNISGTVVSGIMKIFILALRTMPAVIYGLIFIRVAGPGAAAGVMTLGILSIGMCTKLYINTLDSFDLNTANAVQSMGINRFSVIRHCIYPEVKNEFFASAVYRFDVNLREASILGLVGAGGIGTQLLFSMNGYMWNYAGAYILGIIVVVLVIDQLNSLIV